MVCEAELFEHIGRLTLELERSKKLTGSIEPVSLSYSQYSPTMHIAGPPSCLFLEDTNPGRFGNSKIDAAPGL